MSADRDDVQFTVEAVEISDGRKLYLYTFEPVGQETGDERSP